MKINQLFLSIAIILIIFGTIFTTSALGIWKSTSSKIPAKFKSGEFEGEYNPSDIRGSYTFDEISVLFNIPLDDLGNAFAVEKKSDFSSFECKDLESIYILAKNEGKEVGTDSVKIFVALYKGLPITLNNLTYFPDTVKEILLKAGKLTDIQKEYIDSHLVTPQYPNTNSLIENTETENSNFIKGKTTFKEILAIGVKKEDIEKVLNIKIPDISAVIKDFCTENNLQFSTVKSEIQILIDKK